MKNILKIPLLKIGILLAFILSFLPVGAITITQATISNVTYENYNVLTISAYGGNASYDVDATITLYGTGTVVFDGYVGNIPNDTLTNLNLPILLGANQYNATITVYNGTFSATATVDIFKVDKATPKMSLTVSPATTVTDGTVTTVTGTISTINNQLTATLEGPTKTLTTTTSASDTERFNLGTYTYTFSTPGNQNYTARSLSLTLKVVSGSSGGGGIPSVSQKFRHNPIIVHVSTGQSRVIIIDIQPKNYMRTVECDKPFVKVPRVIKPGENKLKVVINPMEYSGNYTALIKIYDNTGVHIYPLKIEASPMYQLPFTEPRFLIFAILIIFALWIVSKR